MTALARTNACLKFALTVFLLGILAVSAAQAVTAVPPSPPNLCLVTSDPNSCDFTQNLTLSVFPFDPDNPSQLSAPPVTLTASPTAVGGVVLAGGFGLTADVGGLYQFALDVTGNTSEIPLGTNGVAGYYDVTITTSGDSGLYGGGAVGSFTVTQDGVPYNQGITVGTGRGTGNVLLGPLYPSLPVDNWEMEFSFIWAAGAGDSLSVDFPLTLDPTPEPVSVLLVGSGIGLLALLRRWRRA